MPYYLEMSVLRGYLLPWVPLNIFRPTRAEAHWSTTCSRYEISD